MIGALAGAACHDTTLVAIQLSCCVHADGQRTTCSHICFHRLLVSFADKLPATDCDHSLRLLIHTLGVDWLLGMRDLAFIWVVGLQFETTKLHTCLVCSIMQPLLKDPSPLQSTSSWGDRMNVAPFCRMKSDSICATAEFAQHDPHFCFFTGVVAMPVQSLESGIASLMFTLASRISADSSGMAP